MTIQRQYSLPNCILTLKGMDSLAEAGEARPTLSVLLAVNCQFPAHNQAFVCDRRFFEQFAQTISQYAQSCLSGIRSPQLAVAIDSSQPAVMIAPAEGGKHKLMVMPPPNPEGPGEQPPQLIELLLTPLQLFDLVETIDQFYGDPKTLPDSQQQFAPVSRRDLVNAAPLVQRAAPVVAGASGLAVAAGVLFMLPVPKVEQPKDVLRPKPTPTPQSQSALPAPASTPSPAQPSPQTRSLAPASPAAVASNGNNAIPPSSVPVPMPAAGEATDGLTSPAPLLTDPQQLTALKHYLHGQLNRAWSDRNGIADTLNYRVSVGEDGAIVGYLPENAAAQASVDRTPLRQLLFTPLNRSRAGEPIAAFRVSFSSVNGVLVTPMKSTDASATDADEAAGPSLTASLRDAARQALNQSLQAAWSVDRAPNVPLMYDLRVTQAGTAVASKPANANATQSDFPLPELLKPAESAVKGDNGKVQLAPLAQFRVVFWPDGSIDLRS